ncbi:MAG: prepilin peptidase [Puniceicoccales bacterium]|jgi:leader peptidase (prepilin peptidase)/N-methyltransferase|nr:prepilin peptidase [Puniceicoccales bacterium]
MFWEFLHEIQLRHPWAFAVCFGVFGAMVGSFLNVCIARVPKGESVVRPGSHCTCGAPIPWFRNIPVLAWFCLRGRAACCGRAFSVRYPLVEALTGALFASCWLLLPWQQALPGMLLAAWLVILAFIDLDTMFLPDTLNISLAIVGIVLSVALPGMHGYARTSPWFAATIASAADSLTGVLAGTGLVYWFRLLASWAAGREAMGEGDVILLGGIGAFCGWQGAFFALFGGSMIGALVLLPLLLVRRIFRHPAPPTHEREAQASSHASCEGNDTELGKESTSSLGLEVPFGPWLAAGAMVWVLLARAPLAQFVAQFRAMLASFTGPIY